jgi:protein involved in polysaccharide export with SLBB domain
MEDIQDSELTPSDERQSSSQSDRRSQFQAFVAEATGQDLQIYGFNLFRSPKTYAAVTNIAPPSNYILGTGDQIQLQIWGSSNLSINLTVDRAGQVMVPRVGPVNVAGLRVEQIEGALKAHIGKVLTNFELAASVSRLRSIQVYVVGQAQRPGTYTLSSLSTLINALFASGGPNPNGSMRNIELKRAGRSITTIDLYEFISRGDQSSDISLQPGDVIVIPPVGPQVAIHGAFDHAAIYELKESNYSIADVLRPSGGLHTLTSTQMALLERVNRGQTPARQVMQIELNTEGLAKTLQGGDVLTLLGISPAFANSVTLQGSVAAPLRYPWFEGMRLLDLIPE